MREFIMVKFNVVALIELPSNGMAHFELQLNYSHVSDEFCSLFNFAAYTWWCWAATGNKSRHGNTKSQSQFANIKN